VEASNDKELKSSKAQEARIKAHQKTERKVKMKAFQKTNSKVQKTLQFLVCNYVKKITQYLMEFEMVSSQLPSSFQVPQMWREVPKVWCRLP
jgi:hypothetical protein